MFKRKPKILITGAAGMLGSDLSKVLSRSCDVYGAGDHKASHLSIPYEVMDLTREKVVRRLIEEICPQWVFHTAAMTDVDGCETEKDRAIEVNFEMTKKVVDACTQRKAGVIFFSSDYIFDGTKEGPYLEDDKSSPLNVYGETKLLAENYIREHAERYLIFRVTWLFGVHGKSFPKAILKRASCEKVIQVVSDQIGRPTFSWDVAEALGHLLTKNPGALKEHKREVYHIGNEGQASWYDLARYLLLKAGLSGVEISPITSHELNRVAKRPQNSVLSLAKIRKDLGIQLRPWEEAACDFLSKYDMKSEVKSYHG
ncbi:MAG: dTDP-4-dehydrorhamnose reductase [Candidatus Omnitrophica bacterium]|nr:dTDP-4-dehydrorhamnose reductase [Candidatus Omnitrophota bacterium]